MTNLKNIIAKGAFGTVAAGAMALATTSPAMAAERFDSGTNAGDVIAGAFTIGKSATVMSAYYDDDRRYRDRRYRDRRYDDRRYGDRYRDDRYYDDRRYRDVNRRDAIDSCVYATEREASRYFGTRRAQVTEIDRVKRTRYGVQIQGRIDVPGLGYGRRGGYGDTTFSCYVDQNMDPAVNVAGYRLRG